MRKFKLFLKFLFSYEEYKKYVLIHFLRLRIRYCSTKRAIRLAVAEVSHNMEMSFKTNMNKMLSCYALLQKVFPQFKNINFGKEAVLVATGPSFNKYEPVSNAIHVGVNAAVLNALRQRYPDIHFEGYDPAMEMYAQKKLTQADLVINTDVLEHIPEETLPGVIEEIASISSHAFFVLHHFPVAAILPDGQNAHITVKPPVWYWDLMKSYFNIIEPLSTHDEKRSVVVTFKISKKLKKRYERLVFGPPKSIWKKYFYKVLYHLTTGETSARYKEKCRKNG